MPTRPWQSERVTLSVPSRLHAELEASASAIGSNKSTLTRRLWAKFVKLYRTDRAAALALITEEYEERAKPRGKQ